MLAIISLFCLGIIAKRLGLRQYFSEPLYEPYFRSREEFFGSLPPHETEPDSVYSTNPVYFMQTELPSGLKRLTPSELKVSNEENGRQVVEEVDCFRFVVDESELIASLEKGIALKGIQISSETGEASTESMPLLLDSSIIRSLSLSDIKSQVPSVDPSLDDTIRTFQIRMNLDDFAKGVTLAENETDEEEEAMDLEERVTFDDFAYPWGGGWDHDQQSRKQLDLRGRAVTLWDPSPNPKRPPEGVRQVAEACFRTTRLQEVLSHELGVLLVLGAVALWTALTHLLALQAGLLLARLLPALRGLLKTPRRPS